MELNFEIIFWTLYGVWVLIAIILFGVSFAKKDKTFATISYIMFGLAVIPLIYKAPWYIVFAWLTMTN